MGHLDSATSLVTKLDSLAQTLRDDCQDAIKLMEISPSQKSIAAAAKAIDKVLLTCKNHRETAYQLELALNKELQSRCRHPERHHRYGGAPEGRRYCNICGSRV